MLRRWFAKLLFPQIFEDARDAQDRLCYVRLRLSELDQWCGYGFPEIQAAVEWVRKSERVHFMALDEYDAAVAEARETGNWAPLMAGNIDKFRDQITDRFDRRPERAA